LKGPVDIHNLLIKEQEVLEYAIINEFPDQVYLGSKDSAQSNSESEEERILNFDYSQPVPQQINKRYP